MEFLRDAQHTNTERRRCDSRVDTKEPRGGRKDSAMVKLVLIALCLVRGNLRQKEREIKISRRNVTWTYSLWQQLNMCGFSTDLLSGEQNRLAIRGTIMLKYKW
jgi:hypothetical protein